MPRSGKPAPSPRHRHTPRGDPPAGPAEGAIIIFAKAPVPGTVKTRMCPPLTPDEAATLQGSLVMDAVEGARSLRDFDVYVACIPGAEHPFFQTLAARHHMHWCDQTGNDLGRRMDHALANVLSRGYRYAVLVGTDTPALARHHYTRAKETLRSHDVVFGPAEDGGYYLVGLKRPIPALFDTISWSTEHVLAQSRAQAETLGLTVGLLDRERDLDTFDDVRAIVRDNAGAGRKTLSTRTANVLYAMIERHGQRGDRHEQPSLPVPE